MNHYQRPTALEETANAEAMTVFAEHMSQFNDVCDVLREIERNLPMIGNDAFKAALLSPGRVIQTDDGTQWQHDLDLTKITSVCHRRTAGGLEFAIVECLPFKSGEAKGVLNSGHNVREVLQAFMHDQRQVLNLWKEDLKAQVREHLAEKYPGQDMNIVAESFEIKMTRAISEMRMIAQGQSRGIRIRREPLNNVPAPRNRHWLNDPARVRPQLQPLRHIVFQAISSRAFALAAFGVIIRTIMGRTMGI